MEPGKALFTRQLTEKEIANLDLISVTPGIFQAHIEKAYEVRATVVRSRIFAAKIDSQSAFATRTDWRRAPFEVQYEAISLPPEIRNRNSRPHATFRSGVWRVGREEKRNVV
jgi:hypothetical protein